MGENVFAYLNVYTPYHSVWFHQYIVILCDYFVTDFQPQTILLPAYYAFISAV